MILKTVESVTKEIYVAPCIKCGCDDISIYDCNYSSFNVGGGICKNPKCNYDVHDSVGCLPPPKELVAIWNRANDISILIENKKLKITALKEKIKTLQQEIKIISKPKKKITI